MKEFKLSYRTDPLFSEASDLEDKGRIADALRLYEIAARLGDPFAQSNLATLLDDEMVPSRPTEAVYWYKRAVRAGYPGAAWNLAMHYKNLGRRRWFLHWLHVAARMGDEDALEEVRSLKRS